MNLLIITKFWQGMGKDIEMRMMEGEKNETESEATDYADDPHVYSNKWEYIMSILGVCVGFGSFWRFPYLVYKNGGGVFLIPYFLALFMVGLPLLYL